MFRCPLASVYIQCDVVYLCFNLTETCFDWFYVCFELVEPSFPLCGSVSSDPQSSRARKLCVTMEPALLLKGDILVGNFPHTLHHCNTSIICLSYWCEMVAACVIAAPASAGEVLPSAESVCRERGGVQGPVPHVHHSRSPAVVWQDRTGRGMHRYRVWATSKPSMHGDS